MRDEGPVGLTVNCAVAPAVKMAMPASAVTRLLSRSMVPCIGAISMLLVSGSGLLHGLTPTLASERPTTHPK